MARRTVENVINAGWELKLSDKFVGFFAEFKLEPGGFWYVEYGVWLVFVPRGGEAAVLYLIYGSIHLAAACMGASGNGLTVITLPTALTFVFRMHRGSNS